jgi:hypothetical protein
MMKYYPSSMLNNVPLQHFTHRFKLKPLFLGGKRDSFWGELKEYLHEKEKEAKKISADEARILQEIEVNRKNWVENYELLDVDEHPDIVSDHEIENRE